MNDPTKPGNSVFTPLLVVTLLLCLGVVLQRGLSPDASGGTGQALPPLLVEGWVNADAGVAEASLRGKVVVVDFWELWCGPCLKAMPEMAEVFARFADREDFVLIGLTSDGLTSAGGDESDGQVSTLEQYIAGVEGFDWPVGYGARPVFDALDVQWIPTLVLFDRSGHSVWRGRDVAELAEAIEKELGPEPDQPSSPRPAS